MNKKYLNSKGKLDYKKLITDSNELVHNKLATSNQYKPPKLADSKSLISLTSLKFHNKYMRETDRPLSIPKGLPTEFIVSTPLIDSLEKANEEFCNVYNLPLMIVKTKETLEIMSSQNLKTGDDIIALLRPGGLIESMKKIIKYINNSFITIKNTKTPRLNTNL